MMIDLSYLFQKYNIQSKGMLHLGSSTGQEAEKYKELGITRVIWVEAIPDVYQQLLKHLHATGCEEGASCINACVSDETGKEVEFKISNNEAQSSSFLELGHHKVIHPTVEYIDSIKLLTITVPVMLGRHGLNLDGVNFLNADLQGAELLALKGMGATLSLFKYLYLEINKRATYVDCAMVDEVDKYVDEYGFKRVETGDWVADTWTDALFIKE